MPIGEYTKFKKPKFLVIGDIMIDRYIIGEVNRISPEAPIQVVDVKLQYDVLGGAANCARNISTIVGGDNVVLIGVIGKDEAGSKALELIDKEDIGFAGIETAIKPTTVKERVFASNQQLLRVDIEDREQLKFDKQFWNGVNWDFFDYIIISDYAKGVVNKNLMDMLVPYCNKTLIDPKPENWHIYPPNVLLVTPNESEHRKMKYGSPELPCYTLVTEGKNGMTLYSDQWAKTIAAVDVPNSEVIGAGDTVIAMIAVCLSRGYDIVDSAKIANRCAGYVVSQKGTAVVPYNYFISIIGDYEGENL